MQRRTLKEKKETKRDGPLSNWYRMAASRASSGTLASVIEKTVNGRRRGSEGRGHVYIRLLLLSFSYAFYLFKHIFRLPFWFFPSFLYSLDAVPVDILCLKERRCWSRRIDNENSNYKRELLFFFLGGGYLFKEEEDCWARQEKTWRNTAPSCSFLVSIVGASCMGPRFFFYYSLLLSLLVSVSFLGRAGLFDSAHKYFI